MAVPDQRGLVVGHVIPLSRTVTFVSAVANLPIEIKKTRVGKRFASSISQSRREKTRVESLGKGT